MRKSIAIICALYIYSAVAAAQGLPLMAGVAAGNGAVESHRRAADAWRAAEVRPGTAGIGHEHDAGEATGPQDWIEAGRDTAGTAWSNGRTRVEREYRRLRNGRYVPSGRAAAARPGANERMTTNRQRATNTTGIGAALRGIGYSNRSRENPNQRGRVSRRASDNSNFDPNCRTCRMEAGWYGEAAGPGMWRTEQNTRNHRRMWETGRSPNRYGRRYGAEQPMQGHNCAGCHRSRQSTRRTSRYVW